MIIPVVMQTYWFKQFVKVTDVYLFILAGYIPEWPDTMHKSLTIGSYFNLLKHQPWYWSQVQFMGRLGIMLSVLHHTDAAGGRDILCQF